MNKTTLTITFAPLAFLCLAVAEASAFSLTISPEQVILAGPYASQHLLVLAEEGGQVVRDLTGAAKLTSSNTAVATADAVGIVRAVGTGEAVITATVEGKEVKAKVTVVKATEPYTWSFRNHVLPMMTKIGCNSGACHGALAGKGGFKLSLRGFAPDVDHFAITRQALGRRVDKLHPGQSLVLLKPTMALPHGGGQKLEVGSLDYQLFADWIASGAPAPRDEDIRIQRLEVFPPQAVLKPKDTLQVVVRAWYSDGHSEDVTRWAKFNSTEDLVAAVDGDGKVKVAGYGETAITMWYANLVAVSHILSPLPNTVDPKTFAGADRHNFVDDLVLKKQAALHIPPSPLCTDAEFIRRAYLDAAGILPSPEEVLKFVADSALDKRAKLISALLERPEFVDYWAYKWSDLLLVSSRKLPQSGVWAFYRYIHESVADNKPWDRFAKEILTANGSCLDNGAANYYRLHKDVTDLNEATSVTFLGMSITCCRCHNHPLEKWTQDQYWGMANLFARVALKNGDRAEDVVVQSLPFGDVLHPRRGTPMKPTALDAKPLAEDSPVERRQYFADWLTAPENPYFARALVNRVWRNFLGRGLVEAEDDLRQTNPPTNEELFQALAKDFIEHKYDVKQLIRTVMNSAAYQRSSRPLTENVTDDRFYSHYLIRRLPAEVILDAYSQVTGVSTPFSEIQQSTTGGLGAYVAAPPGTRALQLPDSLVVSSFLEGFGRPERIQTCSCERRQDSSVGQALHLNNGQTLNDKLRAKGSRLDQWIQEKLSDDEIMNRLFLLALGREPTPAEKTRVKKLLVEAEGIKDANRREVLEDLFWGVLAGDDFLFNH